jgi:hypothetical protein
MYKKCHVYTSKFVDGIFIFYNNYRNNENVKTLLKTILKKFEKDLNLRLIGINIPIDIQSCVFKFNNALFINKITNNELLLKNMSLEKNNKLINEKELINNYYNKYLKFKIFNKCNKCIIQDFTIMDCRICTNCYCLYY